MTVFTLGAQAISGTLKDNNNAPLSYANVVVMTTDSFFVDGGVSDKDGGFLIPVPSDDNYLLKISSVGFQTVFRNCTIGSLGVIVIPEQSLVLGEAVVIAHRPVYELKNGKLITNVQNSLLSKIGTASDVLNHIPGVQGKDGAYSVFGKGTPSIYLNGRLVRDLSELERLGSENIARVEVLMQVLKRLYEFGRLVRLVKGWGWMYVPVWNSRISPDSWSNLISNIAKMD